MKKLVALMLVATVGLTTTSAFAGDDYAEHQAQSQAKLSFEKAKAAAIKAVGGGTVTDVDFDLERGRSIYEVEVLHNNTEYDVKIDANTGEVLRKKVDY